jgi:hypothetical protein
MKKACTYCRTVSEMVREVVKRTKGTGKQYRGCYGLVSRIEDKRYRKDTIELRIKGTGRQEAFQRI